MMISAVLSAKSTKSDCSCGSGKAYADCCQPYHLFHAYPASALVLMKSRFCAFVEQDINYIIATTLPAQQVLLDKEGLQAWASQMHWSHLQIVADRPKVAKRHAQVHFCAYYHDVDCHDADRLGVHDELSTFVKCDDRWYFLDPTVPVLLTNKQPCFCGSGEKFKACCGRYL